jgi:hypothetical protein
METAVFQAVSFFIKKRIFIKRKQYNFSGNNEHY